jgi:hypothetical protein
MMAIVLFQKKEEIIPTPYKEPIAIKIGMNTFHDLSFVITS